MSHLPMRNASRAVRASSGRAPLRWPCCALVALLPLCAGAAQVEVAGELERLASVHGFTVTGAEHIGEDAIGRADGEQPYQRLRVLLEGFDHIIVQGPEGGVERVIVLGVAKPGEGPPKTQVEVAPPDEAEADGDPSRIELPTVRNGNQHVVRVSLETADGERLERALVIDTGADMLVLPASMIEPLGVDEDALSERQVQTANGRVEARIGKLPAIWLGEHRTGGVEVAFLDDDKLGGNGLLGMSVLGRYQLTIDDEHDLVTLIRR